MLLHLVAAVNVDMQNEWKERCVKCFSIRKPYLQDRIPSSYRSLSLHSSQRTARWRPAPVTFHAALPGSLVSCSLDLPVCSSAIYVAASHYDLYILVSLKKVTKAKAWL
jgi:hypothetical protein